jgi:hypothetical protein
MASDRFFNILRFLHFENSDDPSNHDDPDNDILWKRRKIVDTLNNKYCELCNPTENLAAEEVVMLTLLVGVLLFTYFSLFCFLIVLCTV